MQMKHFYNLNMTDCLYLYLSMISEIDIVFPILPILSLRENGLAPKTSLSPWPAPPGAGLGPVSSPELGPTK